MNTDRRLRVLIVEDSADDAGLMVAELRRAGLEPETRRVETEPDFLAGIRDLPDIILADRSLPHFDGLRALDLLQASGLDIPFILVSGTAGEDVAVEAMRRGASDYLLKDRLARLASAVERALTGKRVRVERNQAEAATIASECRYRRLFEMSRDGILILDAATGRIVDANPFLAELLGYTRETLVGRHIWELGFSKDAAANEIHFKELQAKDHIRYDDLPLETSDGRRIDVEFVGNAYIVDQHRVMQCSIRDITGRRRLEEMLAVRLRIASMFSTILDEEMFDGVLGVVLETMHSPFGAFGYIDESGASVVPTMTREVWDKCQMPERRIAFPRATWGDGSWCRALRERRTIYSNQPSAHIPAGHVGIQRHIALPIVFHDEAIGLLMVANKETDYTEEDVSTLDDIANQIAPLLSAHLRRERAEAALVRLGSAVEQAAETIVITDTEARILYANPAFEQTTGYTRAEALGQNPRILKSGRQDDEFYRRMWEVLGRGEIWRGRFINKRKDGELYEEEVTISPVRDATGRIVNYVAVKRDVTREVQWEAQFRQSQKMEGIGQFAGGVAHDFNNILTAMMMQVELAGMVEHTPEEVREGLREIRAAAERAANLTRQLLLFSRKEVMQPRELDLNEVVSSLAKMLRRIIRENVALELHLQARPLPTYADAGMLDQVLMNLTVNARDAMPQGGRLMIQTTEKVITAEQAAQNPEAAPGRFVCLSVRDTGCGIPPEIRSRIFEPFFTTKEAGKGTGLGLATVFGIVKQHRGWLEVHSEVGQGATFEIFLPASALPAHAEFAGEKAGPGPRGRSETILVVEDDTAVRTLTRRTLERNGYHVLEAADGVTAQQIWTEHQGRIALLLTDLIMPGGVDGLELAARLRTQSPNLRVIFASGYSADIAGRELKLAPGQTFLPKPYPPDQLVEAVRKCLDR